MLPPSGGGGGIPRSAETGPAASLAAWSACLPLFRAHLRAQHGASTGAARGQGLAEGLYQYTLRVLLSDAGGDPLGVGAAYRHVRLHHEWLRNRANADALRAHDPVFRAPPNALPDTFAELLASKKK